MTVCPLLFNGHTLVVVMDNPRPAGAALAAEIGPTVSAEQLGGQQVIVLGLMSGRGLFVFGQLLLHPVKQVLRNDGGDTVRDYCFPVSELADVPPVFQKMFHTVVTHRLTPRIFYHLGIEPIPNFRHSRAFVISLESFHHERRGQRADLKMLLRIYDITHRFCAAVELAFQRIVGHTADNLLRQVGGIVFSIALKAGFQNDALRALGDNFGCRYHLDSVLLQARFIPGAVIELGRQAIPVIANECIVRVFYFIRRLAFELRENSVNSLEDIKRLNWNRIKSLNNPTLARMLTIATGVFTTIDIGEAVNTRKYWVAINYVGVGRFAVAIGQDVAWCLKARNMKKVRQMYEDIKHFTYMQEDDKIYRKIGSDMMDMDRFGLTIEQTEILYNFEYHKTLNDIRCTKVPIGNEGTRLLKRDWLEEWQKYMTAGFSSFLQAEGAELHWYSEQELTEKVEQNDPTGTWFRLALLEAMLFEPYYPISVEKDKKGNDIPSKRYKDLQNPLAAYKKGEGDAYLDRLFTGAYYADGYIKRLRKGYSKVQRELNEVLKTALTSVAVAAGVAIVAIATAGAFAPAIAVALVGSNFAGLSGAALTSACLAYLGGGAVAIGGAGMAGGAMVIVGGGAALGLGVGAGVGGAVGAVGLTGKKNTIRQSSKLLVAVREIFLNDEHDLAYSNSIYEQYVRNIAEIEKGLVELRLKADVASGKEKKMLKAEIKEAEDSVEAMKIARKSMAKFTSSFEAGLAQQ